MKVLLVGHVCGPHLGSEPGLTWNWAWHLSQTHEVTVLTIPFFRESIERFLAERPNPNLRFRWVELNPKFDPWKPHRGHGGNGISERGLKLHYLLWQREALGVAFELHRAQRFDLAHYVSWNTVSAPPLLWRLPIPFIWGPVGGGMSTPESFRHYFGGAARAEALRSWRLRLLPWLPALRRTVRRSRLLFATNRETAELLTEAGAPSVEPFFDNGILAEYIPPSYPPRAPGDVTTFLWAGRLEPRKALPLALEAMAEVRHLPVRLLVAGDGPLRAEWEALAARLGVSRQVQFLGSVPWQQMADTFRRADAFIFTSLRDSYSSVTLEAMAQGLPVLTLNHQGVGELVTPDAGIKVPVTTPAETVAALAAGVRDLAAAPELRRRLGEGAWRYARTQTWGRRAEAMGEWYKECLRQHGPVEA
jgi:glycosyltransferase involved in cell wall biosynthesis